jgi:excisionase family DNA binding protein
MQAFLTLGQAAVVVGVTRAAVWQALHNGSLPAHKDGAGRWQIDPVLLETRFAARLAKRQLAGKETHEVAGKPLPDNWRVAVKLLQQRVARLEAEMAALRHAEPVRSEPAPSESTAQSAITAMRDWWPAHDIDLLRKLRDAMGYEPGVRFTRLRQLVDDYNAEAVIKRSRKAIQHKLRLLTRAG